MPYSEKAKHFFQMAYAMSHGHRLQGISKETKAELRKVADSTSDAKLHEMATAKVKKK